MISSSERYAQNIFLIRNGFRRYAYVVKENGQIIEPSQIVQNSFNYVENGTSKDGLKLGLCADPYVRFEYYTQDIALIKKEYIKVMLYAGNDKEEGNAFLGWFEVDECIETDIPNIYSVTAYCRLKKEKPLTEFDKYRFEKAYVSSPEFVYKMTFGVFYQKIYEKYPTTGGRWTVDSSLWKEDQIIELSTGAKLYCRVGYESNNTFNTTNKLYAFEVTKASGYTNAVNYIKNNKINLGIDKNTNSSYGEYDFPIFNDFESKMKANTDPYTISAKFKRAIEPLEQVFLYHIDTGANFKNVVCIPYKLVVGSTTYTIYETNFTAKHFYGAGDSWDSNVAMNLPRNENNEEGTQGQKNDRWHFSSSFIEDFDFSEYLSDALEISGCIGIINRKNPSDKNDRLEIRKISPDQKLRVMYPDDAEYPEANKELDYDETRSYSSVAYSMPYGNEFCEEKRLNVYVNRTDRQGIVFDGVRVCWQEYNPVSKDGFVHNTSIKPYGETNVILYDLTDNKIIKNGFWTYNEIRDIADKIVALLPSYIPYSALTPADNHIEMFDSVRFYSADGEQEYTSLILKRTISGDQFMIQEIEATAPIIKEYED